MTKNNIKQQLIQLTSTFLEEEELDKLDESGEKSLFLRILSDSMQAITYISLIEGEFDIAFDDDDIDSDFFIGFNKIVELIIKNKKVS
jgi:acyl carrier protein